MAHAGRDKPDREKSLMSTGFVSLWIRKLEKLAAVSFKESERQKGVVLIRGLSSKIASRGFRGCCGSSNQNTGIHSI